MTRKPSGPRSARPAAGKPLFGHREYPVNSAVDALLALSKSLRSYPFRFLLWTEDRKGFREYHDGQSIPETEYGYSTKEELFLTECTSRGDRWRYDIVSEHATLWNILRKEQYQAVVICGEDLTSLASRAIYYFDRVPFGPKTVILAFHERPIELSHLDRLWSFLKGQNRLHLLKSLAYLNSSPSNRKFLPIIYERQGFDPNQPIWQVPLDGLIKDHILLLFSRGIEEGDNIDYKEIGCLSSKSNTMELLKDCAAMANASGGIILVGIRESDGRPIHPPRLGLQNIRKPDQQINRLLQMISTRFEEAASNFKIRSLQVLEKRLLLIKVFHSVESLGGKKTAKGHMEYPVRSGRITIWKRLEGTAGVAATGPVNT
jgi:Putative DNA-binding domain